VSKNFTVFSAFLDSLDFQPNPGGKIVKKTDRQKRIADFGLRNAEKKNCGFRIAECGKKRIADFGLRDLGRRREEGKKLRR
jgi:hypothetical protein